MGSNKNGVAMPFVLVALVVATGFVMTITSLNQGVRTQLSHANNHQHSFLMAYSIYSRVLAKIHSFSWANRPFKDEPFVENMLVFKDGHYDLLVEDTPGQNYAADVYVRTHLAGMSRLFFWRVRYNDDLLDVSNRICAECFLNGDPADHPALSGPRPVAEKVDEIMSKRAANQAASDRMAVDLSGLTGTEDVVARIGGRLPDDFAPGIDIDEDDLFVNIRPPADFPELEPPGFNELPDAPGPGATTPGATDDFIYTMSGKQRMEEAAEEFLSASEKYREYGVGGWEKIRDEGPEALESAQEMWEMAGEAHNKAYESLNTMIDDAADARMEAPSLSAQKAIEEMVAQTVAAGLKDVSSAVVDSHDMAFDDGSYLRSLPTSDAVASLLSDWQNAKSNLETNIDKWQTSLDKIAGYSMDPEVATSLQESMEAVRAELDRFDEYIAMAEAQYEALKAIEEEEARRAAEQEANSGNGDY